MTKEQNTMKNKTEITCAEFWALPAVIAALNVQKANPYGSKEHREADEEMITICAEVMGRDCALEYFGEY
jgi:hypothetical protein